ncbi:baculoviral IAP repeat-containing protein 7-like [Watersipora subatra]|uniref:baculoviral IAP repeat-containing protein 7-like n=1 Tax=Watersipora subatra TaxID=2589382 RepID=UPI00355B4A79
MSPREFLDMILHELSLVERESLLVDEKQRRTTFLVNWPHDGNLSGIKMAQAGFYCLDDNDRVQCVFCRGCLHKWEEQDDPMTEHRKHFPFCLFVKGLECGNKEYGANDLTAKELRTFTPLLTGTKRNKVGSTSVDFAELGINSNRPKNPQHALYLVRLKSFARWPANSLVTARDMCCAGFFYTESGDMVTCFHCNVSLRYWRSGEDPWTEHARMSPYCGYLLQRKKKHFIDQVNGVTINESETKRKTNEESKSSGEMPSIADMINREKLPAACCIPCFQKTRKEKARTDTGWSQKTPAGTNSQPTRCPRRPLIKVGECQLLGATAQMVKDEPPSQIQLTDIKAEEVFVVNHVGEDTILEMPTFVSKTVSPFTSAL